MFLTFSLYDSDVNIERIQLTSTRHILQHFSKPTVNVHIRKLVHFYCSVFARFVRDFLLSKGIKFPQWRRKKKRIKLMSSMQTHAKYVHTNIDWMRVSQCKSAFYFENPCRLAFSASHVCRCVGVFSLFENICSLWASGAPPYDPLPRIFFSLFTIFG